MGEVVASSGENCVATTAGVNGVVAAAGLDVVVAVAESAVGQVDVVGAENHLINRGRAIAQHSVGAAVGANHIAAAAAYDNVGASTADQRVRTGPTKDDVIAIAAVHAVVTTAAFDVVVVRRGDDLELDSREAFDRRRGDFRDWHDQGIHVWPVALDAVTSGAGEDQIIAGTSDDRVVARVDTADPRKVSVQRERIRLVRINRCDVCDRRGSCNQVNGDRFAGLRNRKFRQGIDAIS